jgi:glyoxylase-like metal-dependent hydrolase (beta-lactamase superfamily II)
MCLLSPRSKLLDDQGMHTIELGDVSITRVPHFVNRPLTTGRFFPGTDHALWEANRSWLAPAYWDAETDLVTVAVQSWLLRSAGATILVDTGLAGQSDVEGALAAAGTAPAEIDLVVCTHLHADHVGGNAHGPAPAFPNARYAFAAPDLAFFDPRADGFAEQPGRSAAVHAASIEPILRSGQALVWDGSHAIDENLRLDLTPGHTPGHNAITLVSGTDRAVFAGDILHAPAQVLEPGVSSCFCHDPAMAARTRRRILGWAADHSALVLPAHFAGAGAVEVGREGSHFTVRPWAGFAG